MTKIPWNCRKLKKNFTWLAIQSSSSSKLLRSGIPLSLFVVGAGGFEILLLFDGAMETPFGRLFMDDNDDEL